MCPRTRLFAPHTHPHIPSTQHICALFYDPRACVLMASPDQPGGMAMNPATYRHTHPHHPLWISVSCPLLGQDSHASLIYGHAGPKINEKVPTCIYARKVFAEPVTLSRL